MALPLTSLLRTLLAQPPGCIADNQCPIVIRFAVDSRSTRTRLIAPFKSSLGDTNQIKHDCTFVVLSRFSFPKEEKGANVDVKLTSL